MGKGSRNRRKGHTAERYFAKVFQENGFPTTITTRHGSLQNDSCGIDLMNIPVNVQIKAGYAAGLNYGKSLAYTKRRINEILGPDSRESRKPTIIIHRKDVGKGRTRKEFHDLVVMSFSDFLYLFNKAFNNEDTSRNNIS